MEKKIKKETKAKSVVSKKKVTKSKLSKKEFTDLEGNVIQKQKVKKKSIKEILKNHFEKYKKIYKLVLAVILGILVIVGIYIGIRNYIINRKYKEYEKIIDSYGFSMLYNNESSKSTERVTRLEMVKIILSSIYNTNEVESIGFSSQGDFQGDEWAVTAEAFGIIEKGYITKENYNEIATYKEAVIAYLNARSKLMDIPVSSSKESDFRNLQSFSQEERKYINDAAENGIIQNSKKKLSIDNKMYKGEFNKLVVTFVEKYNTLAPEGDSLVTKEESKPSNYEMYPYILYSVSKEAYEYTGINENGVDYKKPVETYKYKKDYYDQMQYRTEYYYNTILNIDYRKLNTNEFSEKAENFLRYDYSNEIKEYINYVKENKIIIEGKATVQLPVFYLDGIRYRARVKLTFEIKNSETDKNILLGDMQRGNEVTYKNKKYEIYIDAPMGTTMLSDALLLDMESVIDLMVSNQEASSLNEF